MRTIQATWSSRGWAAPRNVIEWLYDGGKQLWVWPDDKLDSNWEVYNPTIDLEALDFYEQAAKEIGATFTPFIVGFTLTFEHDADYLQFILSKE